MTVKTIYKRDFLPKALFFWILVFLGGAFLLVFPEFSSKVAKVFGIGRGADIVLYLGTILSFFLIYKLYLKIEKLEKKLDLLARKLSLKGKH